MTWLVSLSIGNTEGQSNLLRDPRTLPARVPLSHVDDGGDDLLTGPLGPGFVGAFDENSRRYFRWISARCRRNSVDGLKIIAERINRSGRMKTAHRPATMRSEGRRLGDRFRERLRTSSWCFTSTDSATTERAPPGPASRATVTNRCRNRTARSRTAASYQDRDTNKECSGIWNSPWTAERPLQFPAVASDVRRGLLHTFPYAVYFRPSDAAIVVLAVLHLRRNPKVWRGRAP